MYQLTQHDLMTYLQLPKHFWAKVHGQYNLGSPQSNLPLKHLRQLATEYVKTILLPNFSKPTLSLATPYTNGRLKTITDGVITEQDTNKNYLLGFRSSTSLNRRFIQQLAFQKIVAADETEFHRIFIILLSPHYLRTEQVVVEPLFQVQEVTQAVEQELPYLKDKIASALKTADLPNPNELFSCVQPDRCPCLHLCHPKLPEYSIYDMVGLSSRETIELRNKGITKLEEIPLEVLKEDRQVDQRNLTKNKLSYIDQPAIKRHLNTLTYPVHFLDYEAYGFPVPLYPGYWPLSSVVFQFSLHILEADGRLEHHEFLHTETEDPSSKVIQALKDSIRPTGSIVVWDKTLESSVHNHLARLRTQNLLFLLELNQRLFDLQDLFSQGLFLDYRFKGSLSLKKILPVLVPEFNHQDLVISNGLEAANTWYQLVFSPESVADSMTIQDQLKEYCALDTLGCVKIFQKLTEVTTN